MKKMRRTNSIRNFDESTKFDQPEKKWMPLLKRLLEAKALIIAAFVPGSLSPWLTTLPPEKRSAYQTTLSTFSKAFKACIHEEQKRWMERNIGSEPAPIQEDFYNLVLGECRTKKLTRQDTPRDLLVGETPYTPALALTRSESEDMRLAEETRRFGEHADWSEDQKHKEQISTRAQQQLLRSRTAWCLDHAIEFFNEYPGVGEFLLKELFHIDGELNKDYKEYYQRTVPTNRRYPRVDRLPMVAKGAEASAAKRKSDRDDDEVVTEDEEDTEEVVTENDGDHDVTEEILTEDEEGQTAASAYTALPKP